MGSFSRPATGTYRCIHCDREEGPGFWSSPPPPPSVSETCRFVVPVWFLRPSWRFIFELHLSNNSYSFKKKKKRRLSCGLFVQQMKLLLCLKRHWLELHQSLVHYSYCCYGYPITSGKQCCGTVVSLFSSLSLSLSLQYSPPLIPPRGEVNAADAFDIGSFDEEDTKGIKVKTHPSARHHSVVITRDRHLSTRTRLEHDSSSSSNKMKAVSLLMEKSSSLKLNVSYSDVQLLRWFFSSSYVVLNLDFLTFHGTKQV